MDVEDVKWLEKFTPVFTSLLRNQCEAYLLTDVPNYQSPKWYQYQGFLFGDDDSDTEVRFKSSQCSLAFYMPLEPGDKAKLELLSYTAVYSHFRTLKYNYLREYFPQISI